MGHPINNITKRVNMNAIDHLGLLAQLENEFCEFYHAPKPHNERHPAVDYIIQPFGYNVNVTNLRRLLCET